LLHREYAALTTFALFLGSAPLPYATMMFSHSLVVGVLLLSLFLLSLSPESRSVNDAATPEGEWTWHGASSGRADIMAGICCGWAVASEYSSALVVLGIVVFLLLPDWRRFSRFALGACPPLLLVPAYSWLCLGTLFTLPYSHQACFLEMQNGLFGITSPNARTAFNLLFSPERGLFVWSPFLCLAVLGCSQLGRLSRRLFWLCAVTPVIHVLVLSGRTWDWPAGPTLSARLLSPILPLLALPCGLAMQRYPILGVLLSSLSVAVTVVATLTNACPPFSYKYPLFDFHIPLLVTGTLSPNLGTLLSLSPYASAAVYGIALSVSMAGVICVLRMQRLRALPT
jgi:hypothetical protein